MRIRLIAPVVACAVGLFTATAFGFPGDDTAPTPAEVPSAFHLALDKSIPEADQTAPSPDRISLWFTQAPQMSGTSIRLVPEGGEPLDLGDAKVSKEDDKLILLDVPTTLADGSYQVYWRAMAQDGHTVRGDFAFGVKAAH